MPKRKSNWSRHIEKYLGPHLGAVGERLGQMGAYAYETAERLPGALYDMGVGTLQAPHKFTEANVKLGQQKSFGPAFESGMEATGAFPGIGKAIAIGALGIKNLGWTKFLDEAEEARRAGVPDRDIHRATGVWWGADGQPRMEIDDSAAKMSKLPRSATERSDIYRLPEAIKHKELFRAYPELKDTRFFYNPNLRSIAAHDPDPLAKNIQLHPQKATDPRSVTLHEIQHGVQDIEGLASGASVSQRGMSGQKVVDSISMGEDLDNLDAKQAGEILQAAYLDIPGFRGKSISELKDFLIQGQLQGKDYTPFFHKMADNINYQNYRKQAGEVESRMVQSRKDLSPTSRPDEYPPDWEDVPRDQQIVNRRTGPAFMASMDEKPLAGIRAYHGSPHDFDKFSMDQIGTGEGAQAYGHGLYFAEREGVARSYRDALADSWESPKVAAKAYLEDAPNREAAIANMSDHARTMAGKDGRVLREGLEILKRGDDLSDVKMPGHMYEVNINADPESFLDWDAVDWQQPQAVRDYANSLDLPSEWAGNDFVHAAKKSGEDYTSALKDAGIPGIRYLDQGSRGAGEGTSNYVVFDDQLIDIVKKYMAPAFVASGATYGLLSDPLSQTEDQVISE